MFKCKDCKYLDYTQKHSVGYVCLNKNRRMVTTWGGYRTLSHLKYPTNKACATGFERREDEIN